MNKIEQIVLQAILEQNGLSEDEYDLESSFAYNGFESIDMVETFIEIEDVLRIEGIAEVELYSHDIDVNEDNFYSLVKYVEGKL